MACEPDEHMRRAIVEKAKELGMGDELYNYSVSLNNGLQFNHGTSVRPLATNKSHWHKRLTYITPGEFYDRLCRTAKPEPPIRIGGHEVKFGKGEITVGCTTVPNDIVRKIAERLKD